MGYTQLHRRQFPHLATDGGGQPASVSQWLEGPSVYLITVIFSPTVPSSLGLQCHALFKICSQESIYNCEENLAKYIIL